jgi:hypothetical protein
MEGPAEKPLDWDQPFYYRWMPKISLKGFYVFVEYVASPVWNYIIVPFYSYTMGPFYQSALNVLGFAGESQEILNETTAVTSEL